MRIRLPKPLALALVALLVAGCRGELPYQGMLAADLHALARTSFDEELYKESNSRSTVSSFCFLLTNRPQRPSFCWRKPIS